LRKELKTLALACIISLLSTGCAIYPIKATSDATQQIKPLRIYKYVANVTIDANASDSGDYSGSASATWVTPNCDLEVNIDLDSNVWTFTWTGAYYIILPLPAPFFKAGSNWKVSDDTGYSNSSFINPSGTIYLNHTDANVWCHTEVQWTYTAVYWWIIVDLTVNIYTRTNTNPIILGGHAFGGGGPHCHPN
jgi:hypothetical protein